MADSAVFLDRDGTLIQDPGYLNHPDQVQVIDGVADALKEFQALGYKTIVASNQSGVARGLVTVEMLERIHDRLRELLAANGATLDAIYYCPYHPEGVIPEYRKDSDWRKPQPGMLLAAAREMDLDLSRSWMIGDSDRDVEAGRRAGCRTILIGSAAAGAASREKIKPDYVAVNIREAVNILKRHRRTLPENRRTTPVPEVPQTSEERILAARSAEILAMPQEPVADERVGQAPAPRTTPAADHTETNQLLANILEHLRRVQTQETQTDFSLMRMLAGVIQVFVPVCLLLAVWFLMGSKRQDNNVFLTLSFAAVLQMMSLTFYIMQGRR